MIPSCLYITYDMTVSDAADDAEMDTFDLYSLFTVKACQRFRGNVTKQLTSPSHWTM